MPLNPNVPPSGNFDLSNWKITLPVDSSGGTSGTAVEVLNLTGYESPYFFTGADGAMVFRTPADGATTSGSSYARSELREMSGTARAAWDLSTGGSMVATLEVDEAAMRDGQGHKIIVGQIHGQDDELVRLYWHDNKIYFMNDQATGPDDERTFQLRAADGSTPDVSLDERFSYGIHAKGDQLEVEVYADGKVYESVTTIDDVWNDDRFYFKAGAYDNANEDNGSGASQASFYDLRFTHDGRLVPVGESPAPDPTPTPDPAPAPDPDPTPDPDPVPQPDGKTVSGDSSANRLTGTAYDDTIRAKGGSDYLWGKDGNDELWGGAGRDYFTFDTPLDAEGNVDTIMDFNPDKDTVRLNDTVFTGLSWGKLSSGAFRNGTEAQDASDRIIYDRDEGSLYYDPDGTGSTGMVKFAVIDNHARLTAADFIVM